MSAPYTARIVSPDRILFDGEVAQVSCRTKVGEIGVLAHHISLVGALDTCRVTVTPVEGGARVFAVRGGFVEIRDNVMTLLTDRGLPADEIDAESAHTVKSDAQQRVATGEDGAESDEAWADLLVEMSGH